MRYLLFFVHPVGFSFHSSAASASPLFLLLRPSRAVVKPQGMLPDMLVPGAAFDCLDASSDTLLHISHDCISQTIYLVVLVDSTAGPWKIHCGMALTERGDCWSVEQSQCFYAVATVS